MTQPYKIGDHVRMREGVKPWWPYRKGVVVKVDGDFGAVLWDNGGTWTPYHVDEIEHDPCAQLLRALEVLPALPWGVDLLFENHRLRVLLPCEKSYLTIQEPCVAPVDTWYNGQYYPDRLSMDEGLALIRPDWALPRNPINTGGDETNGQNTQ